MYNSFASVYNELMDKSLYPKWLEFTNRFIPLGTKKVLDVACGAGDFSSLLVDDGFKVMGVDLSDEMLSLASDKVDLNSGSIMFVKRDMRDLFGLGVFDLVTCFDDSLNYLLDFKDIEKVFAGVSNCLKNKGVFLFDVISPYKVDVVYKNFAYNYYDKDKALMWNSYKGDLSHSVVHDLLIFKYDSSIDAYHNYTEQHKERAYKMSQYEAALKGAGFRSIMTFADFGNSKIDPKTERWFFVAKKD